MLYAIFSKCINILAPKIANCDKFNEYINRTRGNDDNGGDVGLFRLQD